MSEKIEYANAVGTLFSQGKSIFSFKDAVSKTKVGSSPMSKSPRIVHNTEVLYIADSDTSVSSRSSKTLAGIMGEKILTPRGLPKVILLPAGATTQHETISDSEKNKVLSTTAIIEESNSIIMNDSIVSIQPLPKETKTPPKNTVKPKSSLLNGNAVLRKGSILTMNKGSKSQLDIQNISSPRSSPRNDEELSSRVPKIAISSSSNEGKRPSSASKTVRPGSHSEGYSFASWGGTAMNDFVDHLIPAPANSETTTEAPPSTSTSTSKSSSFGGGYRTNLKGKSTTEQATRSATNKSKSGVIHDGPVCDVSATSPRLKSATAYRHAYALLYMNKANKNAIASSKIDKFLSVAIDLQKKGLEREESLRFAAAAVEAAVAAAVLEEVRSDDHKDEAGIPEEVIILPQRFIRKKVLPSHPMSPPPQRDRDTAALSSTANKEVVISQDMIVSIQKQIRNYTQIRDLHSPSGLERLIQVKEQERINIRSTNCRSVNDFMKTVEVRVSPPPSAMARKATTVEERANTEKKEKKKLAFDDDVAVCEAPLPTIPPPEMNVVKISMEEEDPSSSMPENHRSITVKFPVATVHARKSGDRGEGDRSPNIPSSMFRRKSWSTHGKRGSMSARLSMDSSLLDLASMQSQSEANMPEGSEHRKIEAMRVKKDLTLHEEIVPEAEPATTATTTTTTTALSIQPNRSQQTFRLKPTTMSVYVSKRPPADGVDIHVSSPNYPALDTTTTTTTNNNNVGRYRLMQQKHTSTWNNDSHSKYILAPDTPPPTAVAPAYDDGGHPDRITSPQAQTTGRNNSLRNINLGYSIIGSAISSTSPTRPGTADTRPPSTSASRPGSAPQQYSNRWRGHKL